MMIPAAPSARDNETGLQVAGQGLPGIPGGQRARSEVNDGSRSPQYADERVVLACRSHSGFRRRRSIEFREGDRTARREVPARSVGFQYLDRSHPEGQCAPHASIINVEAAASARYVGPPSVSELRSASDPAPPAAAEQNCAVLLGLKCARLVAAIGSGSAVRIDVLGGGRAASPALLYEPDRNTWPQWQHLGVRCCEFAGKLISASDVQLLEDVP